MTRPILEQVKFQVINFRKNQQTSTSSRSAIVKFIGGKRFFLLLLRLSQKENDLMAQENSTVKYLMKRHGKRNLNVHFN